MCHRVLLIVQLIIIEYFRKHLPLCCDDYLGSNILNVGNEHFVSLHILTDLTDVDLMIFLRNQVNSHQVDVNQSLKRSPKKKELLDFLYMNNNDNFNDI